MPCDSCRQLAARIERYLEDLLVWLVNPAVAPDNNAAERALRPAVVTRKTSFGSRSKQGAQAFARLRSLIQTWERQGLDFFDTATPPSRVVRVNASAIASDRRQPSCRRSLSYAARCAFALDACACARCSNSACSQS